jgi:phosphoribosyl-dephospho-CoA transferase
MLGVRRELATDSLVANWVDRGWPLVGRRPLAGEPDGAPLGLPLPPLSGKKRLSFLMPRDAVVATMRPPGLRSAIRVAPRCWRSTLLRLCQLASEEAAEIGVFGSLSWRLITGLDYLTDRSDLDFILHIHRDTRLRPLTEELARIEADAPMRLDGELVRGDGAAINWREVHAGARELLVKSSAGVALLSPGRFLAGRALS